MKFEDLFLNCVFTLKSLGEFQNVETDTSKNVYIFGFFYSYFEVKSLNLGSYNCDDL